MDLPRIGQKKEPEPPEQSITETDSSDTRNPAGIADQADSVENASDQGEMYLRTGWAETGSQEIEQHAGLGGNDETQSLVIGIVDRSHERSGGGWAQFKYTSPSTQIGDQDVALGITVNAIITGEIRYGYAAELSIGHDTHLELGWDTFHGASARLEGSAQLGEAAEVHGGAELLFGAGWIADVDLGFKDGVFSADISLGVAALIGFEVDYGVSIDPGKAFDIAWNAASGGIDAVGDWLSGIGDASADAVDAVSETAGDVMDAVSDAASETAEKVVDLLEDVADW